MPQIGIIWRRYAYVHSGASVPRLQAPWCMMQGCAARGPAERAVLRKKEELRAAAAAARPSSVGAAPGDPNPDPGKPADPAPSSRSERAAAAAQLGQGMGSAGSPNARAVARARAARVNLLRGSVAEALTWLRAPPAPHERWAHPVRGPARAGASLL